jgi:hypothetical protein
MVAVPAAKPATTPVDDTVAIPAGVALHDPPVARSDSDVLADWHTADAPVMVPALGSGFTVTNAVLTAVPHTLVTIYEMTVVPVPTPVTTPVLPMVAIVVVVLLHEPPADALESDVVPPGQTENVPAMLPASGLAFTVTTRVAAAVPHMLVTV